MTTFRYLLKRELWEHHAFWIAPLVLAVLAILGGLAGLAELTYLNYYVHSGGVIFNQPDNPAAVLNGFLLGTSAPFNWIMLIVVAAFLLRTLAAERRDRSILFWKSLPISDTASVTAKLMTAVLIAPAIMFAIVVGVEIVLGIIYVIAFAINGLSPWPMLAYPWLILGDWATIAYALVAQSLWYLPFYGWFLLASGWARNRGAFLWAVLPPIVAIIVEGWVFRSSHVANTIIHHLFGLYPLIFTFNLESGAIGHAFGPSASTLNFAAINRFMTSINLWVGVAVGIVFTIGAIALRHYRDET
jgi:ABC-2 type transport system permease protein